MSLQSQRQLANAEGKLALLVEQIAKAETRSDSLENAESVEALVRMANQMREGISRYRSRQTRRAS